jgi:hypothetical protein
MLLRALIWAETKEGVMRMKTLTFNRCGTEKTDALFIDLDIPFNDFESYFKIAYEKLLSNVLSEYGYTIEYKKYSQSKNGYTHVVVIIDSCISFDKALLLKFLLGDDRNRINLELWRFKTIGNPLDYFNYSGR